MYSQMALRGVPVPQPTSRKLPEERWRQLTRTKCEARVKKQLMKMSQMKADADLMKLKPIYPNNLIQSNAYRQHIFIQGVMKKDIEPVNKDQSKVQPFETLTPQQQDQYLKKEINKRIRKNQINKIRNMSISDVNSISDREVDPPMDQSRLNRIRLLNMKMGVTEDTLEHSVKTPGEKYLQMIEKSELLRKRKLAEYKKDPVMAQIKRGKLGADNFFIFFGIFGSLMIPLYIYNKFRRRRQEIVASRIAPPEVIRRLDQDSPISLEDINVHQIKYFNPQRVREQETKKRRREEREKLERELYF